MFLNMEICFYLITLYTGSTQTIWQSSIINQHCLIWSQIKGQEIKGINGMLFANNIWSMTFWVTIYIHRNFYVKTVELLKCTDLVIFNSDGTFQKSIYLDSYTPLDLYRDGILNLKARLFVVVEY